MKKDSLFISVVVPHHNGIADLKECLLSLVSQSYPRERFKIIVVDNALDRDLKTKLSSYLKNITIIEEERKGVSYARNKGVSRARGEIVAFIDQDCVAEPDWLANIAMAFSKNKKAAVVAGEIRAFRPRTAVERYYETLMCQKRNLSFPLPYFVTANVALRRSVFDEIGPFDSGFPSCEDVDMSWRLIDNGYEIEYAPQAVVYHKNIRTLTGLFKKIFLRTLPVPKLIKKYEKFLKKNGAFKRINLNQYKKIFCAALTLAFARRDKADRETMLLDIIFLSARKLSLFCGSIMNGYIYL